MLQVSQKQLEKFNSLNERFKSKVLLPDYEIVTESKAQGIGAWFGRIYIAILANGASHS